MESILGAEFCYGWTDIFAVCYTLPRRFVDIPPRIAELHTSFDQIRWNSYDSIRITHDDVPWFDLYNLVFQAFLSK